MNKTNLPTERRQAIVGGINNAREEFVRLMDILNKNTDGVEFKKDKKNYKKILQDRTANWIGGTYRLFEDQNKGLLKLFGRYKPTAEAEEGAINFFKRMIVNENPTLARKPSQLENRAVIQVKKTY